MSIDNDDDDGRVQVASAVERRPTNEYEYE